jgi:hypothetical protein
MSSVPLILLYCAGACTALGFMCARGGARGCFTAGEVTLVPTKREPNRRLAAVMEEADISRKGLGARVRAASRGAVSSDHVSVGRWLAGVRPHDETIRLIAAVLSVKLGRSVSYAEIGFDLAEAGTPLDALQSGTRYSSDTTRAVEVLDGLTEADLSDSPAVMKAEWDATTVPSAITGYLFADPGWHDSTPASRAEVSIAVRIRATARNLTQLDFQYGGGHTRTMLLFYWKSEILPALRATYVGSARREIFAAAADAAEVLGWSAYDAGRHGAAQRYFIQGLRLAREAGDSVMGGQILSNLSHQANYLGNFNEAVHLARAAQTATAGKASATSATVNAMFLAMEARALASLGDARGCGEVLRRAEQEFERRRVEDDPDWISYFDCLELAGESAHCFRDLGDSRQTQVFATQAIDPVLTPARTRSFISMVHADGVLAAGNLDEAVSLASESVELAGSLQSNRYFRYVGDFYGNLIGRGYGSHPSVCALADLISQKCPDLVLPTGH